VPIGSGDVTCTLVIFGTGAMSANPQLSTFAQDGYGLVFVFRVSLHQAVSGGNTMFLVGMSHVFRRIV
jgi:hypothetical protein